MTNVPINKIKSKGSLKNFGLVLSKEPDKRAYVLGSLALPFVVLKEDGQWDQFMPKYEPQFNDEFDSDGCTVWGSLNALEFLVKYLTNVDQNYSERFNYILAKVRPPGADPHQVIESIRDNGVIAEALLPFLKTQSFAEFLKPNPMTRNLLDEGMKFPYEIQHEYVWAPGSSITKEQKVAFIKAALKTSPIGVTVTAWFENDNGVYVDENQPNTHWCVCFGWNDQKRAWKIFDSYDQSVKLYSFDSQIDIAKRFHLEKNNYLPKLSLIGQILAKISQLIAQMFPPKSVISPVPVTPTPMPPTPAPVPAPKVSLLEPWARAIEQYEGANKAWNNPGAIRGLDGQFLKFKTHQEGFDYLKNYLVRAATGKHPAYVAKAASLKLPSAGDLPLINFQEVYSPSADKNNPVAYATFISKQLGVSLTEKIKNLI